MEALKFHSFGIKLENEMKNCALLNFDDKFVKNHTLIHEIWEVW